MAFSKKTSAAGCAVDLAHVFEYQADESFMPTCMHIDFQNGGSNPGCVVGTFDRCLKGSFWNAGMPFKNVSSNPYIP